MNAPADFPKQLKLIPHGDDLAVVLPPGLLARLGLAAGDAVDLHETPGGIELTRHDPDAEEQIAAARAVIRRRREALRELAK